MANVIRGRPPKNFDCFCNVQYVATHSILCNTTRVPQSLDQITLFDTKTTIDELIQRYIKLDSDAIIRQTMFDRTP